MNNEPQRIKCSACGEIKLVHVVAVFHNHNQLPYCEDCWVVMFCSTITPQIGQDDAGGLVGVLSAGSTPSTPVAAQGQAKWCGKRDKGFTCTEPANHTGDHIARLFDPETFIVISQKIKHQWAGVAASEGTSKDKS